MCRICWLWFVNSTFKVGHSSWAQKCTCFWWSHVLMICLLITTFPLLTPCVLLLAGGHTPLPKGWCHEMSRAQQNKKIQAEVGVCAHTHIATHVFWVINDDWEVLFLYEFTFTFVWVLQFTLFFWKILLVVPLERNCIHAPKVDMAQTVFL